MSDDALDRLNRGLASLSGDIQRLITPSVTNGKDIAYLKGRMNLVIALCLVTLAAVLGTAGTLMSLVMSLVIK